MYILVIIYDCIYILVKYTAFLKIGMQSESEHPYSLKKSILYSQALRPRRISSTFQEYCSHSKKLIEQFVNKGYKRDVVLQQIQKVDQLD